MIFVVTIIALGSIALYLILSEPNNVLDRLEEVDTNREYFTALESYQLIRPIITAWNSDAVITGIRGMPWHGKEGIYSSPDGRMPYWRFVACSTSAKEWTRAALLRGYAGTNWGEKPGGELQGTCRALPVLEILDTDIVITTARSRVKGVQPQEIYLSKCLPTSSTDSYCWNVEFDIDPTSRVQVSLDAYSGEVINIFQVSPESFELGKDWFLE